MCDTIYAPAILTKNGIALFGKNSDRDPNEAHLIEMQPRAEHTAGEELHCTYMNIPQVAVTNAVLLAKPFWIWGAEMGANEFGVTIGNEAVFTKVPYEKNTGLTGMDLLRLGLERAATAYDAMLVIIQLLEEYGQGGNCSFLHKFYYHNSFLIVDPTDAWVLETAGKHWAAEHVNGARTISNALTITDRYDVASDNLVNFAIEKGWCKRKADFNFSACYSDTIFTIFSDGRGRQACTTTNMISKHGGLEARDLMQQLRVHRRGDPATWSPDRGLFGADVCMHAGVGPVRINETTGSMVSELGTSEQLHWFTGTTAPCTGIFKPIWFQAGLPDQGQSPTGQYDPESLWWKHERLHREVIMDYDHRLSLYRGERDELEESFIRGTHNMEGKSPKKKYDYSKTCFETAQAATQRWYEQVKPAPINQGAGYIYKQTRKKFDKLASIP